MLLVHCNFQPVCLYQQNNLPCGLRRVESKRVLHLTIRVAVEVNTGEDSGIADIALGLFQCSKEQLARRILLFAAFVALFFFWSFRTHRLCVRDTKGQMMLLTIHNANERFSAAIPANRYERRSLADVDRIGNARFFCARHLFRRLEACVGLLPDALQQVAAVNLDGTLECFVLICTDSISLGEFCAPVNLFCRYDG